MSSNVCQSKIWVAKLLHIIFIMFFLAHAETAKAQSEGGCSSVREKSQSEQISGLLACVEYLSRELANQKSRKDIPSGTIVAWYNDGELPDGWLVANGENGTPDLRGKFLQGVGTFSEAGDDPEGAKFHTHGATLSSKIKPGHPHTLSVTRKQGGDVWLTRHLHEHTIFMDTAPNIPPNFKIVYIVKK